MQGHPNEKGTQIDNARFIVFNCTLEGEEGGRGVKERGMGTFPGVTSR